MAQLEINQLSSNKNFPINFETNIFKISSSLADRLKILI